MTGQRQSGEGAAVGVWALPGATVLYRVLSRVSAAAYPLLKSIGVLESPPGPVWSDLERVFGFDCSPEVDAEAPGAEGEDGPLLPMRREGYDEALSAATASGRLLVVYLHSRLHQDTEFFCSETLRNASVLRALSRNYFVWAADVASPEGDYLANSVFFASSFPYLAVVLPRQSQSEVLVRVEGPIHATLLAFELTQTADHVAPFLHRQRMQRQAAALREELRAEQDAAYQAAVEADRAAAVRRAAEEVAAEQAAREEKEREARLQREREEEAAEEASVRERRRALLPPPPTADDPSACRLRVHLPGGQAVERRFRRTDLVQVVHDFVCSHEDYNGSPFSLSRVFPHQPLPLGVTLQHAGLCPRAVVVASDASAAEAARVQPTTPTT
eukprot:Hpha_TRINITY_DN27934_c0_g1::TRINITY_DN27934_c0_g1_i1::g.44926::m.44926/K18726/FAF2, UBXD8; FAS-associated factor 2